METTVMTEDFSIKKLAQEADNIDREHRFAATLFAFLAVTVFFLAGFIVQFDSPGLTPPRVLQVVGIPLIFAYAAFLYFRAVKDNYKTDWTLATKIKNEKEKLARLVDLYRKVPAHILLPLFLIIMINVIPNLLHKLQAGAPVWKLLVFLVSVMVIFSVSLYGLKHAGKNKLGPVLDKLQRLERQLQET